MSGSIFPSVAKKAKEFPLLKDEKVGDNAPTPNEKSSEPTVQKGKQRMAWDLAKSQ